MSILKTVTLPFGGWSAAQAYQEYRELKEEMSDARARKGESEQAAIRAGAEAAGGETDPQLGMRVQTRIGILLERPEVIGKKAVKV
jgi:hypothetical protein